MFILQENPIDSQTLKNSIQNPNNGALVSFEGMVRNDEDHGKIVAALHYIADTPLCMSEGNAILTESMNLFPIKHAICVQRVGNVNVLESAVWIGVWSGHRDESFKACRYVGEQIKKRLHIWKKEIYTDGTSNWIRGAETPVIA